MRYVNRTVMYPAAASSASRRRSSSYRSRRLSWNSQPSHSSTIGVSMNQKSTSYPRMRAMKLPPRKVVLLRQRPHPALEFTVEVLGHRSPILRVRSQRWDTAPPLTRMHADRRIQRRRRCELTRDDVSDGCDDTARINGAEVAQHSQNIRGCDAMAARWVEVAAVTWTVHHDTRKRGLTISLDEDQLGWIVVGPRNTPQHRRRAVRRQCARTRREHGGGEPLLTRDRRPVHASDAWKERVEATVGNRRGTTSRRRSRHDGTSASVISP